MVDAVAFLCVVIGNQLKTQNECGSYPDISTAQKSRGLSSDLKLLAL